MGGMKWDDIYWENTHIEFDAGGLAHLGICDLDGVRQVVLRVGPDDDDKPHQTLIMTPDEARNLIVGIEMSKRSAE